MNKLLCTPHRHRPAALRGRRTAIVLGLVLALMGSAVLAGQSNDPSDVRPEGSERRVVLDTDLRSLPPEKEDSVRRVLQSGTVLEASELNLATRSNPTKLVLEGEGLRLHAIFHAVDRSERKVKLGDRVVDGFRDSFHNQMAAYKLSRLLGMDNLPPSELRIVDGSVGAATLWIEEALTWTNWMRNRSRLIESSAEAPPVEPEWEQQRHDMQLFDALIDNLDRHESNILIDSRQQLWLVDHTRAFTPQRDLARPTALERCSVGLWSALQELEPREVRAELRPHLDRQAIDGLLQRRRDLLRLFRKRIESLGEAAVLFRH